MTNILFLLEENSGMGKIHPLGGIAPGSELFGNIQAMAELTKQQLKEFQDIWREEYGEDISEEEAYERGSRLVELMRLVGMGMARRKKSTNLSSNQE